MVWNTYRKTRLMILDLAFKCLRFIGSADYGSIVTDAAGLAEGIAASIPFHLIADTQEYLQHVQAGMRIVQPGRPLGGLLMLHPLHFAAVSEILSHEMREYMRRQLRWIGDNMGIGQASLLADVSLRNPDLNVIRSP